MKRAEKKAEAEACTLQARRLAEAELARAKKELEHLAFDWPLSRSQKKDRVVFLFSQELASAEAQGQLDSEKCLGLEKQVQYLEAALVRAREKATLAFVQATAPAAA